MCTKVENTCKDLCGVFCSGVLKVSYEFLTVKGVELHFGMNKQPHYFIIYISQCNL